MAHKEHRDFKDHKATLVFKDIKAKLESECKAHKDFRAHRDVVVNRVHRAITDHKALMAPKVIKVILDHKDIKVLLARREI